MAAAAVAIGNELNEFSQLARDLRVGVNHLAMDTELSHQVEYYDAIQILEERINGKRKHHDEFNDRLQEIKHSIQTNADVLQYLKCITKLELPLTELTRQLTQAALDISDATSAPAVYANKKLGPNVSNCWEYIIELSSVVQTHLKDASVYQQFHHSVNEINAHLEKIITLNEVKMNIFCPEGVIKEARMLATELKNDYDEFLEMWEKAGRLAVISRQLRPIHNRLAKVVRGRTVNGGKGEIPGQIVMVKALVSMTGTNFQINKGDEMILVNNENEHLWKVQTTDGEREVASVIFGLVGPHEESVFQAEDLQKKIASTWKRVLERTRGKLTRYYTKLMKSLCENDAVYFTQEHEMNSFLDDLENLLIRPNYDGGQLQNAYDDFTNTVVLIASNRKPPRDSVVLSAEDIFILHAPLRSVLDQIINVDKVQAQTAMNATEVRDYIKSVELERQRISKELNEIEKNQSAQEEQLQSLARRMQDWKKNRLAFDKAINDYTMQVTTPLEPLPPKPSPFSGVSWNYNKNDPLLEHFPSTRILKPSYTVENDYQATSDGFDGDSNMEVEDTPKKTTPGVSRNLVFEGRHQPDTVPHYEMTTWTGGVKEIRKGLRRSASTSDLQTQIMNVTFSTATQYDVEDDVRHYATIACDPKGVLQKSYPDLFGRKIKKSDCQSQIFQLTKDVEVQVGVRVRPTAINLSKIDMNNLGVEVVDCSEASSLGLKVGSVICPITVRTEMELHDGAGIEILGISDVDSLAVQHKNKQMKAKKISSREVETQIITAPDGKNIIKDTKTEMKSKKSGETTDTQTQITVMSKPAAIQAVAVVEVMDVDSRIKAKPIVTETASSSRLLILPDSELDLDYSSEDSTEWNNEDNEVMAQIGCILHSRGVHVDIKKYLANYTTKQPSEMFDLSTQIESKKSTGDSQTMILTRVSNEESHSYDTTSKTRDAQTLIARVSRDHETQVSFKLIPTEVSMSKIGASIMEVSLRDKHAKRDLNLPMDSIICPSDIRFVSELYDGSEIKIVDYKDVARLLVSHEGVSVVGEITIDKKENCIPVGVQAAVVFKTFNSAQSVLPKLVPGCVQMTRRPKRACPASSSDVQVQIITQPDSYFEDDDDDSKTMNTCELKSLMSIVPLCEHCTRECQDLQVQISTLPPKFVEEGTQFNKSSRKRIGTADCRMEVRLVHNSDLQTLIPNSSRRMSDSSESIVSSELSNIPLCEHCMHMCQDLQVQVNTCPTVQQNVLPDKSLVNLCENCTQICRNLQLRISADPLRTTSVNNSELLKETIRKCISSTECRPRLKLVTATIENSQAPIQKCIANHICRKDDRDDYATSSISFNLPLCNECKRTCQDLQAQIDTLQTKGSISEAEYKAKSTMAGVPLCAPCKRRYQDLQVQITAFPVNPSVKVMKETSVQVGAELTTSEICLSKYELQNIQLTMDEGINDINGVAVESFICPAKIKVKTRLTEGSSIKMVDFDDTSDAFTIRVTNTQSLNAECGQVLPDNMIGSCVILNPTSETSKKTVNALICGAVSDKKRKIRLMEIDSVMMSVQKATVEASTQVGARLMSSSISLCQVPVENMIVEIENTTTDKKMEMGATSLLFPTNTRITTVLCEEEGIQISSLEDVENLQFEADDYEMSRDLLTTDVQTQKGFKTMQTSSIRTGIVLKTNQWCTKLPAATTTATVKNLLKHIKPEPKMRISIGSSKYTSKCDISVQVGKMIRDDSTYTFDINNESTIKSTIEEITRQAPIILDHKTTIQTQPTELKRVIDASVQVGARLVPQTVTISQVRLENVAVCLEAPLNRSEMEVSATSLLCPGQIQLTTMLCEGDGISIVDMEDIQEISFMHQAPTRSCDLQTQIMTSAEKSFDDSPTFIRDQMKPNRKQHELMIANLEMKVEPLKNVKSVAYLPAQLILETGQYSSQTRQTPAVTASVVAAMLADPKTKKNLSIVAKKEKKALFGSNQIGSINRDQNTQTDFVQSRKMLNASMQVGVRIVPESIEMMNLEVEKLEINYSTPGESQNFTVNSIVCPAKVHAATRLCEESGIQIASINDVDEVPINAPNPPQLNTFTTPQTKLKSGWWSTVTQGIRSSSASTIENSSSERLLPKSRHQSPKETYDIVFEASAIIQNSDDSQTCDLKQTRAILSDKQHQTKLRLKKTDKSSNAFRQNSIQSCEQQTKKCNQCTQVGVKMIPQEVNLSKLKLEDMQLEVRNDLVSKILSLPANSILYPAEVTLDFNLCEDSGIQVVKFSDVNEIGINTSTEFGSSNVMKYTISSELRSSEVPLINAGMNTRKAFLQAAIVIEKADRDLPLIGSTASVCRLLQNEIYEVHMKSPIKPTESSRNLKGPVCRECGSFRTQTSVIPTSTRKTASVSCQVGTRIIPEVIEFSTAKIKRLEMECCNQEKPEVVQFDVNTFICPATIHTKTELFDGSGIKVDSLNETSELKIMSAVSTADAVESSENFISGNWRSDQRKMNTSSLDSSKKYPKANVLSLNNTKTLINSTLANSFDYVLQASALIQATGDNQITDVEEFIKDNKTISRLQLKGIKANKKMIKSNQVQISGSLYEEKHDQSTQVGVRMVPQDISLSKIHLEGIQMEVTSERISETLKIQPNSILYPADVHLSSILCEDSGIQFVKLTDVNEMDFSTSVMSSTRKTNTKPVKSRISTFTVSPRNLSQTTIVHTPSTKYAHFGANSQATTLQAAIVIETAERDLPVLGSTAQICRILQDQEYEARLKTCVAIGIDSMNQVGAILVPTQISLEQMNFDTSNVDMTRLPPLPSSVLCTTNMQLSTVLTEASGIQVIDVKNVSDIGIQYETADYLADVIQTSAHKNQASIQLRERTIVSNVPEIATVKLTVCTPRPDFLTSETTVERSSGLLGSLIATKTNTVDTAVQCGTVLVPTKVCMNRVEIDNLEVVVPMTGREDTNLQVSAILCSSGVQMQSVLTDTSGIQVVNMKDIGQIGIQINDQVYVANVENVAKKEERKMSHASIASQQHASRRSVDLASKADDQFVRTVLLPVRKMPHLIGGDYGTAYTQNLVHQNIELTQLRDVLQNSTIELRLQQRIDSSRSIFATSDQPEIIVPNSSSDVSYAPNITPETVMADSQCMNLHQIGLQRSARIIMKDACSQLGLQLIPQSVEVKSIKMENMDVAFTNETTNEKGPFNVGTMICFSGVQYNHNFTESAGIQVLAIDKSREVAIHYREDSFHASVESHESQKTSISNSTTSKNLTRIGQISDAQYLQMGLTGRTGVNTDDNECQINLRVHHAEISGSCLDASYRPELGVQTKESGRIGSVVQSEFHAREYMSVPLRSSSQSTRDVYPYPKAEIGVCSVCNINRLERFDIASQVGVTIVPMEINMKNVDLLNAEICLSGASGSESLNIPLNSIMCPASIEMCTCLTNSVGIQMFNESDLEHLNLNLSGQQILAQLSHPERRRLSGNVITRGLNNQVVSKFTAQSPTRPQKQVNLMEPTMLTASAVVILDTTKASSNTITVPNQNSNVHETVIKLLKDTYSSKTLQLTGENKSGLSNAIATQKTAKEGQFEFMRDGFYGSLTQRNSLMPSYTAAQSQKYDSVQDGTFSGPLPANDASVQVGTIFTPTQIQIEKIDLKNAEIVIKGAPEVTEYQVPLSSILVPASMQMTCDLTECSGISISHMKDTSHLGLSFGNDLFVGTIENDNSKTRLHLHQDDFTTTGHTQLAENTTFNDRLTQRDVGHTISVHGEVRRISVPGSESVAQFACQYCGKENQATSIIHPGQRSYLEENIVKTSQTGVFSRPPSKIKKELKSASVQVGLQLRPKSIALEKCGVDNMLLEVKDDKMGHNLEFPVGAVFYPVNLEMDMELTNRSGIEIQNIHDINEIVVEHGSMDKHVADVYFPPLKRLVNSFESNISRLSTDIFEGKKLQSKTISLKTASVVFPRSELVVSENTLKISSTKSIRGVLAGGNSERRLRLRVNENISNIQDLQISSFTCQCGRVHASTIPPQPALHLICNYCGNLDGFVTNTTEIEEMPKQTGVTQLQGNNIGDGIESFRKYNVTCEAAIEPVMISKRLTANITPNSIDVGMQFSNTNISTNVTGETIVMLECTADRYYCVPSSTSESTSMKRGFIDMPVKNVHISTQCNIIHRDTLVETLKSARMAISGFQQTHTSLSQGKYTQDTSSTPLGESIMVNKQFLSESTTAYPQQYEENVTSLQMKKKYDDSSKYICLPGETEIRQINMIGQNMVHGDDLIKSVKSEGIYSSLQQNMEYTGCEQNQQPLIKMRVDEEQLKSEGVHQSTQPQKSQGDYKTRSIFPQDGQNFTQEVPRTVVDMHNESVQSHTSIVQNSLPLLEGELSKPGAVFICGKCKCEELLKDESFTVGIIPTKIQSESHIQRKLTGSSRQSVRFREALCERCTVKRKGSVTCAGCGCNLEHISRHPSSFRVENKNGDRSPRSTISISQMPSEKPSSQFFVDTSKQTHHYFGTNPDQNRDGFSSDGSTTSISSTTLFEGNSSEFERQGSFTTHQLANGITTQQAPHSLIEQATISGSLTDRNRFVNALTTQEARELAEVIVNAREVEEGTNEVHPVSVYQRVQGHSLVKKIIASYETDKSVHRHSVAVQTDEAVSVEPSDSNRPIQIIQREPRKKRATYSSSISSNDGEDGEDHCPNFLKRISPHLSLPRRLCDVSCSAQIGPDSHDKNIQVSFPENSTT